MESDEDRDWIIYFSAAFAALGYISINVQPRRDAMDSYHLVAFMRCREASNEVLERVSACYGSRNVPMCRGNRWSTRSRAIITRVIEDLERSPYPPPKRLQKEIDIAKRFLSIGELKKSPNLSAYWRRRNNQRQEARKRLYGEMKELHFRPLDLRLAGV